MSKLLILILLLTASFTYAQPEGDDNNVTESGNVDDPGPRDNFYDRYLYTEKQPITYDFIHEKDVFWERKIWRLIDVRERMNHHFTYPLEPFLQILFEHGKAGDITLYQQDADGYEFASALTPGEAQTIGSSVDTVISFDPETFEQETEIVVNDLDYNSVKRYRVKEVWFFDEEKSSLDVRILGIAPIVEKLDDNGNVVFEGPLFWVYYPELREVLSRHESFNVYNDAARMTWEDIFEMRWFSSYIIKESNVYDRRIKDYKANPMDVLLESDKLKEQIFHFEHDLWSY